MQEAAETDWGFDEESAISWQDRIEPATTA
jgi:hypothetical protein